MLFPCPVLGRMLAWQSVYVNELFPIHVRKWVHAYKPQACCWAREVLVVSLFCSEINCCLNQEHWDYTKRCFKIFKTKVCCVRMFLQDYLQPVYDKSRHCYCKELCAPTPCERWGVTQIFFVVVVICDLISKILQMKTSLANMMSASTVMFEEQQFMMMIAFI